MRKIILFGGFCACVSVMAMTLRAEGRIVGGYSDSDPEGKSVSDAASFAVAAQEKVMRADGGKDVSVKLVKVLSSRHQVVAGMNYKMRLRVLVDGVERDAEATVWRKLSKEHELMSWKWKDSGAEKDKAPPTPAAPPPPQK